MPILATRTPFSTPDEQARGEPGEHGEPAEIVLLEEHREDEARESDDRREAEIDLAGADDEGEPDRQKNERRKRGEEGRVDEGLQEDLRRRVHEQRQEQREDEDDRQAFELPEPGRVLAIPPWLRPHALCCRAMRYSVSSITDMSLGRISATIAPRSRITSRSATSWT